MAQDIMDRKRAVQEVQELSARLDFHLRHTPVAVIEYATGATSA